MDFTLPSHTEQLGRELGRWADELRKNSGPPGGFDPTAWRQLIAFGILEVEQAGGDLVDAAYGFMSAARAGLVGPVLEAYLAVAAAPDEALPALASGQVVTSVDVGDAVESIVGWGAAADLVVDQRDGAVLARVALPAVSNADGLPHGWYRQEHSVRPKPDPLASRRWMLASALTYGLLRAALELATEHARGRHQFGRPLAAFQAVQFRLAECLNLLEGIRLSVLDAAWRLSTGRPNGDKAAALCWLMTEDASKSIAAHCHQVFGALGFCTETGLVQLTAGARWLRLTVGRRSAVDEVCADRVEAASRSRVGAPASLVLAGYGDLRGG